MEFLNSIIMKIILIMLLSGIMEFFNKNPEDQAWAEIVAYIIVALIIEQPFKFFVMLKGDKRRNEKELTDNMQTVEKKFRATTENPREFEVSQKIQYKVSACPSCGFKNKIVVGEVGSCEYCGSLID